MSYDIHMQRATMLCVTRLSFEDRDAFIRSHSYDPSNSNHMVLNCEGLNREKTVARYYPHYTLDNLYEYCVFRNIIHLLNCYGRLRGKRAFTLGHYRPLNKGGEHHASNWIIQTASDNQRQADSEFENPKKWTLTEQKNYIMSKIDYHLGVDESFEAELSKYIMKLGKVYQETYRNE